MNILSKFKRIFMKLRLWSASEYELPDLFKKFYGVKMGKNVRITGKVDWGTEPYLIEIGDNVNITQDVRFITHGALHIFRKEYPGINYYSKIKIGSNTIIGARTILLPGVTIGNNTIIGAGSVVAKDIPSNVIAAGNPARIITTIEKYKEKYLDRCIYVFEQDPVKRKKEIIEKMNKKEEI